MFRWRLSNRNFENTDNQRLTPLLQTDLGRRHNWRREATTLLGTNSHPRNPGTLTGAPPTVEEKKRVADTLSQLRGYAKTKGFTSGLNQSTENKEPSAWTASITRSLGGALVDRLFVKRDVETIFEFRRKSCWNCSSETPAHYSHSFNVKGPARRRDVAFGF